MCRTRLGAVRDSRDAPRAQTPGRGARQAVEKSKSRVSFALAYRNFVFVGWLRAFDNDRISAEQLVVEFLRCLQATGDGPFATHRLAHFRQCGQASCRAL